MKIRGGLDYIIFDMEDGYVLKAYGELRPDAKFIVYKASIKKWEPPHENEALTSQQVADLIKEVDKKSDPNTVKIVFE